MNFERSKMLSLEQQTYLVHLSKEWPKKLLAFPWGLGYNQES